MKTFKAVFERDVATGLLVGYVPGFAGAHTQGGTLEELRSKLAEVLAMLLEDGEPQRHHPEEKTLFETDELLQLPRDT